MINFFNIVIFSVIVCLELQYISCSEGKDNKGNHFIFGFMYNYPDAVQEVFITTDCPCTVNVNVSTPLLDRNFVKTFSIVKHQVANVTFDPMIQSGPGTLLSNKGIEITSDKEISVYAVNKEEYTTDAFVVFPVDTLGDNYYVITWSNEAEFMIIATTENTVVNILIAKGTNIRYKSVTYTQGMRLDLEINMYQTFHVHGGPDYTGTKITSNEPITVISGASCTSIGSGACDHVSSQMTPIETFGTEFATINMPNCNRPVDFKIVVSESNTDVNITGRALVSLTEPGDRYSFRITDQSSKVVSSTKPFSIAFFAEGGCGSDKGDPLMILLQPTQQFAADYTFATIDNPSNPFQNALTIVIPKSEISGLKLDGENISTTWRSIDGSDDLRITDINITKGAHTVYHENPTVTFLAISTGLAKSNSYGYSSGQRLAPINSNCTPTFTVPGDIIDNDCDGLIDEELQDGKDNDGDGKIDEDLAKHIEESNLATTTITSTSTTTPFRSTTKSLTTHVLTTTTSLTTLLTSSIASSQPTTSVITTTTKIETSELSKEVLSTDLVITGVVIAVLALFCFITGMFFFKWKRRQYIVK